MSHYPKVWLPIDEQIALLQSRGLIITDRERARDALQRIGYYRLSAYWYPFRQMSTHSANTMRLDTFYPGTTLKQVVDLYIFDKKLRLLVLDAIERIEVSMRVDIANALGEKHPHAHRNPKYLHGHFAKKLDPRIGATKHNATLLRLDRLIAQSREEFIEHHKRKYGLPLPVWASVEVWDFGLLSKFYSGLTISDRLHIAESHGLTSKAEKAWQIMASWLKSLNYIRNVAAHHSRLWNRNIIGRPKLPNNTSFAHLHNTECANARIYTVLCVLQHLIKHLSPHSTWGARLKAHILTLPMAPGISSHDMGFPSGWQQQPLWKNPKKSFKPEAALCK